jgi:sulfoacetaldehyde acetyltransferase
MKMTTEEAFVKVLQMHGIEHAFGIIGSAFMPISDLFPKAGITFWDCAHEGSGGMMAMAIPAPRARCRMMIAQNGPGITNFVTAVKTAYWNHTPLLLVTPQAANKTIGQGGFQEVEQMALFKDMVCLSGRGARPSPHGRGAEPGDPEGAAPVGAGADQRAARFLHAGHRHRPAAHRGVRAPSGWRGGDRGGGGAAVQGEVPGHPERRGRGDRRGDSRPAWRWPSGWMRRSAWATSTTTPSPARIRCSPGRLGYNGSKAAMELIARGRCGAGPGHPAEPVLDPAGLWLDYWPKDGQDHPGRHQPRPDRADQEGHGRDRGRCEEGGARASWRGCRHGRRHRARRAQGA